MSNGGGIAAVGDPEPMRNFVGSGSDLTWFEFSAAEDDLMVLFDSRHPPAMTDVPPQSIDLFPQ